MTLRESHDIGESLQWKIEVLSNLLFLFHVSHVSFMCKALPDVERAFVHLDYEFQHKPEHVGDHRPDWSLVMIIITLKISNIFKNLHYSNTQKEPEFMYKPAEQPTTSRRRKKKVEEPAEY